MRREFEGGVKRMLKSTLAKARELLETVKPEDNAQKLDKAAGLALVWVAAELGHVAKALEALAGERKLGKQKEEKE